MALKLSLFTAPSAYDAHPGRHMPPVHAIRPLVQLLG